MNNLLKLLFILTLSLSLNAEYKFESRFGFLSEGTLLASFKDTRVALSIWLEDIATKHNGKIETKFYDTSASLYEDFKNKKIDMVVLDLPFFFKNKRNILNTSDNFWSVNGMDGIYTQYYLIAKKSLSAKNFKDIKKKTISIKKGSIDTFVWLDKNSYISNKASLKKITKKIIEKKNESSALLDVFFDNSDFAVVKKHTWDIISELNPSISKKLVIVKKSKEIHIPFIGIFHKNTNKTVVDLFFGISKELKSVEGIEKIVEILKLNSLFRINNNSLKDLDNYYNEYFMLKKKYK